MLNYFCQSSGRVLGVAPAAWELGSWVFLASFLATGWFLWLAGLRYRRLPAGTHWSERARVLFPVRMSFTLMCIWVPLGTALETLRDWPMDKWLVLGLGLTSWLGCLLGESVGMAGLNLPPAARRPRLATRLVRGMILTPGTPWLLAMMYFNLGRRVDAVTVVGTLLGCGFLLAWQRGLCVQVCRWCRVMRPVQPEIRAVVDRMSAKLGVPVREVFEMDLGMWNAFALIWTRDLAFTTGLLGGLNRAELEAVTAHELGHLAEGPRMRWMRTLGILPLGILALLPSLGVSFGSIPALLLMAASWTGFRMLGNWARRAEVAADAVAQGTELNAGCYARTLERLYEANLVPAAMAQRGTHPDLYDRMVQAGVTPDFPGPLPARRFPSVVSGLLAVGLAVVIVKLAVPKTRPLSPAGGSEIGAEVSPPVARER